MARQLTTVNPERVAVVVARRPVDRLLGVAEPTGRRHLRRRSGGHAHAEKVAGGGSQRRLTRLAAVGEHSFFVDKEETVADYTIVRVGDVRDMSAEVGIDPDHFEIRFMRESLGLKNLAVTYERFGGGWRAPEGHAHRRGHQHKVQEEVFFLISGRAEGKFDGEIVDLEPWTARTRSARDSKVVSRRRGGGRRLRLDGGTSGRSRRCRVSPRTSGATRPALVCGRRATRGRTPRSVPPPAR